MLLNPDDNSTLKNIKKFFQTVILNLRGKEIEQIKQFMD